MEDIGETIVGDYLRVILGCDFVNFNVNTKEGKKTRQGEIDVVGIRVKNKDPNDKFIHVYLCEVATHMDGLHYNNPATKKSDNVERFKKKFKTNIDYAAKNYDPDSYKCHHMLWSPVVTNSKEGAKNNQTKDIEEIKEHFAKQGIEIEMFVNEKYQKCLDALRNEAGEKKAAFKSPVLRLMQIEERLKKHLGKKDTI
ncbi:MAG: hypothetical protein QM523_09945 [Candidatus Pacebacteria bacterium]|nr:hypothetical protein [Candidatus Paceibacterota bacterium]